MRAPPALRVGSVVGIVAPAGPFDRDTFFRGLAWLALRYRLRIDDRIFAQDAYLAGSDEVRASVLEEAMLDPEVDALYCARGGYGSMRLLDAVPWDAFVARPKRLVGFSDITALHVHLNARGIETVHGPNVTGLARDYTPAERMSLIAALEDGPPGVFCGLEVLVPGAARGPVLGGNLALVEAMAAAGRLSLPEGCILVLEDVTERPYRVDRMLTSLLLGGHLARAGGIVFGDFVQCDPGPDGRTIGEVLRDRTCHLGIPVVAQAPLGHGSANHAFVLGRHAELRDDRLAWDRGA